jgi:N-acetyl-gamma-glutamyl-phosphate reductase
LTPPIAIYQSPAPSAATAASGGRPAAHPAASSTVAVIGGSGYTGALLAELLLRHPSVELTHVTSESLAGEPAAAHLPRLRTDLAFCAASEVDGVDFAFVCLPPGEAAPTVKRLLDGGAKVVDLSADFRLDATAYAEWYGPHAFPEMLPGVYGLTELHRGEIAGADLVANPGCYPTAALLALEPLKELGLLDVVIDAKSGVSGAGKTPQASTHFCAVDSDLVAYGLQGHRHYPEIAAGLAGSARAAGGPGLGAFGAASAGPSAPSLTFIPHLVPLQRGISETIYVRPATFPLPSADRVRALYEETYAGEPFVAVGAAPPQIKDVAGTNCCRLFPWVDERAGRIVVVSVIDNLMKGASGQAVQNMNLMLGFPETEGLL